MQKKNPNKTRYQPALKSENQTQIAWNHRVPGIFYKIFFSSLSCWLQSLLERCCGAFYFPLFSFELGSSGALKGRTPIAIRQ